MRHCLGQPWPNMIPIGGVPAHTTAVINRYNAWLKQTDMPMIVPMCRRWPHLRSNPILNTPPKKLNPAFPS